MEERVKLLEVDPTETIVISRRSFFGSLLLIGSAGMGAILSVPVLRYVLYPLYAKSSKSIWSAVGKMTKFRNLSKPVITQLDLKQLDGWREVDSSETVYVTNSEKGELQVLSSICPHMGCTIAWREGQHDFYCPCHGSVFEADGKHVSGPSPRGMDPLPNKTEDDNLLVKFEYFRENVPNREVLS